MPIQGDPSVCLAWASQRSNSLRANGGWVGRADTPRSAYTTTAACLNCITGVCCLPENRQLQKST